MLSPAKKVQSEFRITALKAGVVLLLGELAVIWVFHEMGIHGWRLALLDVLFISFLVLPFAYFTIVRPLEKQLQNAFQKLDISRRQAIDLARHDGLTGLLSRASVFKGLEAEWERTTRYERPLSCLMIDVDNFKQLNDTHGHQRGDDALRCLASIIKKICRDVDLAGRYGGEEFLIVVPETDLDGSLILAERIRHAVEATCTSLQRPKHSMTVSIGVSQRLSTHSSLKEMIGAADQALLQAKANGKNQVLRSFSTSSTSDVQTPRWIRQTHEQDKEDNNR